MYEVNHSCCSAYLLYVHVVFMTEYHRPVFGELHHADIRQYVAEVCVDFGAELKECDGEADHVYTLAEYLPLVQLTKLVNSLKSVISRWLRNDFIDLRAVYLKSILWSCSYFIGSCGGAPLEVVKKHIQNQCG